MPTKTALQDRWENVTRDPSLQGLPYKIETNGYGQLVLSPHTNRRSELQERILLLLHEHAPQGTNLRSTQWRRLQVSRRPTTYG